MAYRRRFSRSSLAAGTGVRAYDVPSHAGGLPANTGEHRGGQKWTNARFRPIRGWANRCVYSAAKAATPFKQTKRAHSRQVIQMSVWWVAGKSVLNSAGTICSVSGERMWSRTHMSAISESIVYHPTMDDFWLLRDIAGCSGLKNGLKKVHRSPCHVETAPLRHSCPDPEG